MSDIIWRAAAYVAVILLGYGMKRAGAFGPDDYKVLSKVLFNVTIPAAILSNVGSVRLDPALLLLIPMGLGANLALLAAGLLLSRGRSRPTRALYGVNMPGYNVGAFMLPLAQSFLGPLAMAGTCIFDVGNAIMCTGGTYAVVSAVLDKESGFSLRSLAKSLSRSGPFLAYLVFLALVFLGVSIPAPVQNLIGVAAPANGFLAMLMIGTAMDIRFDRRYLLKALVVLGVRYALSGAFALLCFFATPFPLEVRQAVALCMFAPLSALAPVYTEQCGGDPRLAGFVNTLSIPIGMAVIVTLVMAMGV